MGVNTYKYKYEQLKGKKISRPTDVDLKAYRVNIR